MFEGEAYLRSLWKQKPQAWGPAGYASAVMLGRLEDWYGISRSDVALFSINWSPGDQQNYGSWGSPLQNTGGVFNNNYLTFTGGIVKSSVAGNTLGSSDFTVISRVKIDKGRYDAGSTIGLFNLTYNSTRMLCFFYSLANYSPLSFGSSGTTEPKRPVSMSSTLFNDWALVACRQVGGVKDFVVNGTSYASTSTTYGAGAAENYIVGASLSGYEYYGDHDFAIAITRNVDTQIIADIYSNPYRLIQPPTLRTYFLPAETGTTGVIAAALNDAVCSFGAQTGTGGGVSATAEPAALSQSAAIGWQGPIVSAINQAVGNVAGVIGATGALEPGASPALMDLTGGGGATGVLTGGVSLSALLFGTTSDTPAIVYEGTISSTAQAISMQAGGNTGLTGEVLTQVLVSATLAGALGATGVGTMSVPDIDTLVAGVTGLTGGVSATVTTGADIAAKIGVPGVIVSSLEALGLQLVEVTISERIYSVIISTATGRAVFLAPAAGEINISTET